MGVVPILGAMEIFMKVDFGLIKDKANLPSTIPRVVVIKDTGKMIKNMDREFSFIMKGQLKYLTTDVFLFLIWTLFFHRIIANI